MRGEQAVSKPVLNTWIEEDIEIPAFKPETDDQGNINLVKTTKTVKQKTYYTNPTPKMVICNDHFFVPLNPQKYIFKCNKCDWHYKSHPVTHRYLPDRGKLVHRITGEEV